jgi:hypothetical protein
MKQLFLGLWRIIEMELWERNDVDVPRPAHIRFNRDGTGEFQFNGGSRRDGLPVGRINDSQSMRSSLPA